MKQGLVDSCLATRSDTLIGYLLKCIMCKLYICPFLCYEFVFFLCNLQYSFRPQQIFLHLLINLPWSVVVIHWLLHPVLIYNLLFVSVKILIPSFYFIKSCLVSYCMI